MLAPLLIIFLRVFNAVVDIYWFIVIAAVVVSWLVAFGVLNTYHPLARSVVRMLDALTEPVFRRIRRIIPPLGGLDVSPLIVLLILWVLQMLVNDYGQIALNSMNQ
ncbi:MAG: YggT family protein [Rhizomicrobium sp.]